MLDSHVIAECFAAMLRATLHGLDAALAERTRVEVTAALTADGLWSLESSLHNEQAERRGAVTLLGSPLELTVSTGGVVAKALELELGEAIPYPVATIYLTPAEAPRWIEERVAPEVAAQAARLGSLLLAEGDCAGADPLLRLALMVAPDPAAQRVVVPAALGPAETSGAGPEEPSTNGEAREAAEPAEEPEPPTLTLVELVAALMHRQGCESRRVERFVESARSGSEHPGRLQSARYGELARELRDVRSLSERRDRLLAFIDGHWSEPDALLCATAELGGLLARVHEQRGRLRLATLLHGLVLRGVVHDHPLVRLGFRELGRSWLTHHLLGLEGSEELALEIFDRIFPYVPGVPLSPVRQRGRNIPGAADLVEANGDAASATRLRSFARHYLGMRSPSRPSPS